MDNGGTAPMTMLGKAHDSHGDHRYVVRLERVACPKCVPWLLAGLGWPGLMRCGPCNLVKMPLTCWNWWAGCKVVGLWAACCQEGWSAMSMASACLSWAHANAANRVKGTTAAAKDIDGNSVASRGWPYCSLNNGLHGTIISTVNGWNSGPGEQ